MLTFVHQCTKIQKVVILRLRVNKNCLLYRLTSTFSDDYGLSLGPDHSFSIRSIISLIAFATFLPLSVITITFAVVLAV